MSDAFWGVDSLNPATHKIPVKGHPTLFEYVCQQSERVPDFWGRYITGPAPGRLTKKEADYIFNASNGQTRILPIYNQARPNPHSLTGKAPQGEHDAAKAIKAANELGVPAGVFLWCDIEPGWKTSADWYRGWWKTMLSSQYGGMGGIYENPLKWNAGNFAHPYLKALKGDSPFVFIDPAAKWRLLWSQQPCKQNIGVKLVPQFKPAEPEGVSGTTVLWQYAIDCLHAGGKLGNVDLDLANQTGYDSMWSSGGGGIWV